MKSDQIIELGWCMRLFCGRTLGNAKGFPGNRVIIFKLEKFAVRPYYSGFI